MVARSQIRHVHPLGASTASSAGTSGPWKRKAFPFAEYETLAKHFKPKPNAARDWAKLAKRAGQKYMVMTTKHHEGFCHFDTKLTDYCAPKQGPGRDLVARICGSRARRRSARRLLLLADGLAPSRRRDAARPTKPPASASSTTSTARSASC